MGRIRCFLLEPLDEVFVKLRRYRSPQVPEENACTHPGQSYHNASVYVEREPAIRDDRGYIINALDRKIAHDDPRWPTSCACGYVFQEDDEWQCDVEQIYKRADTGEEMTLRDAPAGAMWEAPWLDRLYTPQGPHNLMVKTPGGDWCVDGMAGNCTMKDDFKQQKHHCWPRRGDPPDVTVDITAGPTCSCGAGSIQCGSYHGFLRDGYLED
jgi:hypothetical protein